MYNCICARVTPKGRGLSEWGPLKKERKTTRDPTWDEKKNENKRIRENGKTIRTMTHDKKKAQAIEKKYMYLYMSTADI